MLLAAAFFVAEAFVVSHGALTVAGAVTFVIGSLMLFDPAGETYQVSLWTSLAIAGTLALLLGVALSRGGSGSAPPGRGRGCRRSWVTRARSAGTATCSSRGELWRARSADGHQLTPGERVAGRVASKTVSGSSS